jgi:hypothetical protein
LTSKELFTKNSSWQAKQSISRTNVMFYGDCVKMCEGFTPNFGDKRTGFCIMKTHRLTFTLSPGNFLPKTRLSRPLHTIRRTRPLSTFLYFPPFRRSWGDWGRIVGSAEHPQRTRLPGCM